MKNLHYLTVFALAALLYSNTLNHEYVMDDKAIITQNKFTQKGFGGIADHLTHSYWYGINGKDEGNYRPISGISFSIEHSLFGNNATIGHFLNVLTYGLLCAVLLLWLNRLKLCTPILNLAVIMLFAAHPIHTEVVANIKSRDEIYCLLFFVLSSLQYMKWLENRKNLQLFYTSILLLCSLLSKETSIMLIPLFPMMAFRKGFSLWQSIKKSLAPAASAVTYLIIYLSVTEVLSGNQYHIFDNSLVQKASASSLLATKLWILGEYFKLLLVPFPLKYDYSYNMVEMVSFSNIQVLLAITALIMLAVWRAFEFRNLQNSTDNKYAIALGLLILPLIPISNFFFPIGATMAERFLFIPSLGFLIIAVGFLQWIRIKLKLSENILLILASVFVLIFSAMTWNRNPNWKTEEALFSADLPKLSRSAKAHHNLANIYYEKGKKANDRSVKVTYYESAIRLLEEAIEIYPVQEFYKQLGETYGELGKWDGVIKAHTAYIKMNPNDAVVWMQLGIANGITEHFEEALKDFEKARELNPNDPTIAVNLAKTYTVFGRYRVAYDLTLTYSERFPGNQDLLMLLEGLKSDPRINN